MLNDPRDLYGKIPSLTCVAGCSGCCGPVPWAPAELARVQDRIPAGSVLARAFGAETILNPDTGMCGFLIDGRCSVYEDRPFMCRLFGATKDPAIRCPYGARPTRPLTAAKADKLTRRYRACWD